MSFGTMGVDWEERVNFERLRRERLGKAKKQLKESGMGMFLCYDFNNIRYITGLHFGEWGRDKRAAYVMLPRDADPILPLNPPLMWNKAKEAPWTADWIKRGPSPPPVRAWGGSTPFAFLPDQAAKFVAMIKGHMKDYGVADLPLGVDTLDPALVKALINAKIEIGDGKSEMLKARQIKSKDEIELLRISCATADAAYDAVCRFIRPGVKECECLGVIAHQLYNLGCDNFEGPNVLSGPRTSPNHHDIGDRILRPGDSVFFDIIQSWMGYRTCYYRGMTVGRATKEQKKYFQIARDLTYAPMNRIKAGATASEVAAAWPTDTPPEVLYREMSGHGIGLSIHEPPAIVVENPEKLKTGMVFAVEAWAGPPHGGIGFKLEEMLAVTDTGYDLLTKFPIQSVPECMGGWYEHTNE